MRNLKKILALVLAMMMVLSMMVTANAAFVDADDITGKYTEAVEVLSGIGVIDGVKNEDGTYNFNPQGTLTRAQAAKIVSYILEGSLTGIDAVADSVTNPFSDLPSWAEPYVLYAYNAGVVVGDGNGKYSPNRELTGYEFGKMLLIAAGICDNDDFAKDWKTVVASELKDNGLWNSKNFALSKKLTREEACYLAFNALNFGETVTTTKDSYVVIGITADFINADDSVNGKSYNSLTAALAAAQGVAKEYTKTENSATTTKTPAEYEKLSTAEKKDYKFVGFDYNKDFAIEKGTVTYKETEDSLAQTVFKLSATETYTTLMQPYTQWKSGTTTVAKIYETPDVSVTTAISSGDLFDATGYSYYGLTKITNVPVYVNGTYDRSVTLELNGTTAVGGNGTVTKLYWDWDGYPYLAQVQSTFAKVVDVTTSTTAYGAVFNTYTLGTGAPNFETIDNETTFTDCVKAAVTADYYEDDINPNGAAKGDFVTYYTDSKGVADLTVVKTITGTVSGIDTNLITGSAYTIGGDAYYLSSVTDAQAPAGLNNTPATYAVDQYGYLLGAVTVAASGNYVYVVSAKSSNVLVGDEVVATHIASVMNPDGTAGKITVASATGADNNAVNDLSTLNGLYTYTKDIKGQYILTAKSAATGDLGPKNPAIATNVYANASTKFVYANWGKNALGQTVFADSTTVVTGYTNIANFKANADKNHSAYIDHNNDGIAEVVFIEDQTGYAVANYVYFTGAYSIGATGTVYTVIADAEYTTVTNTTGMTQPGLYNIDASNVAAAASAKASDVTILNDGGLLYTVKDNTRTYQGAIADTVPVYVINKLTNTADAITGADLATPVVGDLHIATVNNVITALYIVK